MHTTTSRPASGTETSEAVDYAAQHGHHRREALRLGGDRGEWYRDELEDVPGTLARANMHATLALAAATMLNAQHNAPAIATVDTDALIRGV